MTFLRYPEYKNIGDVWLGDVPKHWEVKRLKFLGKTILGGTPKSGIPEYWDDGDVPWLPSGKVQNCELTLANVDTYITQKALSESAAKWIPAGSALIALTGATCGNVAYLSFESTGNQSIVGIAPNTADGKYLFFVLLASRNRVLMNKTGGAQGGINQEDVRDLIISLPPTLNEQRSIADFLNRETGKIDVLVAEQEKLISLLNEKRQAVIFHAITKGIDPSVSMKDSGIEWLGEVPVHWETVRFSRVLKRIEQGWSPNASSDPCEPNSWGVLKLSAIKKGTFTANENKALLEDTIPEESYEVIEGDLLLTRANTPELVGDACVVKNLEGRRIMLSDLIYRLSLQEGNSPSFFCCLLISRYGRAQIEADARGSSMTMAKISQGHIKGWRVVVPPPDEQQEIVSFLSRETAKIDALTAEAQCAIELLKEHRAALISAAVTGKIDVRGLAAADAQEEARAEAA